MCAAIFHLPCGRVRSHVCLCVCACVRVRLNGDMFVFIDSKRRIVAAHTAVYRWQGSRLGETCVFKVHTGLIMLI